MRVAREFGYSCPQALNHGPRPVKTIKASLTSSNPPCAMSLPSVWASGVFLSAESTRQRWMALIHPVGLNTERRVSEEAQLISRANDWYGCFPITHYHRVPCFNAVRGVLSTRRRSSRLPVCAVSKRCRLLFTCCVFACNCLRVP